MCYIEYKEKHFNFLFITLKYLKRTRNNVVADEPNT